MMTTRRTVRALVLDGHYMKMLRKAHTVYLTADAVVSPMGVYLLESACLASSAFEEAPLIMAESGFRALQQLCNNQEAPARLEASWQQKVTMGRKLHLRHLMQDIQPRERPCEGGVAYGQLRVLHGPKEEQECLRQALLQRSKSDALVVISQDKSFLKSLKTYAMLTCGEDQRHITTLALNEQGYLYDPLEDAEEREEKLALHARSRLSLLVEKRQLYMDESALQHEQAERFLRNIKPALLHEGKQLNVLVRRETPPPLVGILLTRVRETPATVRFVWLDDSPHKSTAVIQALLQDKETYGAEEIVYITNRLARGEKVQQALAREGKALSVYSVNRHGFLSKREVVELQQPVIEEDTEAMEGEQLTFQLSPEEDIRQGMVKRYQERMKRALELNDMPRITRLAAYTPALEAGIRTALCTNNARAMERLIAAADLIPTRCIRWWMLESKMFSEAGYLSEFPHFYELLVRALTKTEFSFALAAKIIRRLQELDAQEDASHTELRFVMSLFQAAIDTHPEDASVIRIPMEQIPPELPHSENDETRHVRQHYRELLHEREHLNTRLKALETQRAHLIERQRVINIQLEALKLKLFKGQR